jgi:hypothetical protein
MNIQRLARENTLEDLEVHARMVVADGAREQFEQVLLDAAFLNASEEEFRAALMHVIDSDGGDVLPMENFLHERDDGGDDEAAARVLWHTISSPEWATTLHDHPEWEKFLF